MRLIGKREPRSENSWLHNSPSLTGPLLQRGDQIQRAMMHIEDAAELGVSDGDLVSVVSPYGAIEVPVTLTADIVRGTIAVPHGWGHKGHRGLATGEPGRRGERQPVDVQRSARRRVSGRDGVADGYPGARHTGGIPRRRHRGIDYCNLYR